MAIVKVTQAQYSYPSDVKNLLEYISDLNKSDHLICGGHNIIGNVYADPDSIAEQFLTIQKSRNARRRLYHLIISFDSIIDEPTGRLVYNIGQAICSLYNQYQSVFTVHEDTYNLHIHLVINNCPVFPSEPNLTASFNSYTVKQIVDDMIDTHIGLPLSHSQI